MLVKQGEIQRYSFAPVEENAILRTGYVILHKGAAISRIQVGRLRPFDEGRWEAQ